jgi:hypothetical protein
MGGEGYGHMGPFCLGDRTFDSDMVDLALSLCIEIGIGASDDGKDCTMS